MFPAIIALISILGLVVDPKTITRVITDTVSQLGPASAVDTFKGPIEQISSNRSGALLGLVVGIALALWTASGYVGAFMRASNAIYEREEGRPFWLLRPLQLLVTFVLVMMAALVVLSLIVSGPVASAIGSAVGLGDTAVTVWDIAKWPVMLLVVMVMLAVLYWPAPNAPLQELPLGVAGRGRRGPHLDRRLRGLRVLRGQLRFRTTRPTARSAA